MDMQDDITTAQEAAAPADPQRVVLKFPYTTDAGKRIEQVSWRRLNVADLKAISRASQGDAIEFEAQGVARMCGLIPEDLARMDMEDFGVLQDRFRTFQGR